MVPVRNRLQNGKTLLNCFLVVMIPQNWTITCYTNETED
jgi:hypothetical protein